MQAVGGASVDLSDMRVVELSAQLAAMTAERDAAMGELHDTAAALLAAQHTIAALQAQLQEPACCSKSSPRMTNNTPLAVTAVKAAMAAKASKSASAASPAVAVTPAAAARMAQATGETPLLLPSFGMGMAVDYNATLSWSPMGAALDGEASPACRPMLPIRTPATGRQAPRRRSTEAKASSPSAAKDAAKRKTAEAPTAEEAGTPAPTPGRRKTRRTAPNTPTEEQVEAQAEELVEAEEVKAVEAEEVEAEEVKAEEAVEAETTEAEELVEAEEVKAEEAVEAETTEAEELVEVEEVKAEEAVEAEEKVAEEAEAAPVEEVQATSEQTVAEAEEAAEAEEEEEDSCSVCNKANGTLLLCDGCDTAFHLKCCKPVLRKIPKGDWFCATCKKTAKETKEPVEEEKEQQETARVAPAETKSKTRGRGRQAAVASESVAAATTVGRRSRSVVMTEPIAEEEESTWAADVDKPHLAPLAETTQVKAAGKDNKRRMSWAPDNALEKVRHFRKENAPAAAAQEITPKLSAIVEPAPKRGRKAAAVEPTNQPARRTTRMRK
jgi:hypothetical protein